MQDMVWCNLFLFTSIRGPARSCMLVLQGRGGGHWRMFTLWLFGLLWVMGMALAWDKVNHQEDTTQQTFRNDTTRLQRHDCADLEVKFPHNPPSRCFHALTTVNDDHKKKIPVAQETGWTGTGGKGRWVGSGLALQPDRRSRSRSSSREHELRSLSTTSSEPHKAAARRTADMVI